ncbi:putative phage abortive infection protein [Vibrio brasiliensis]|uniref:Phage abortive infection protein n=1 Tax=Vibrio brasiliensis LMG 20546 TaxID=945543 RepID=E8LW80_9VIBR|nr:putative phage abortive infection protein [Vibrio brasiliensis]EGA64943.1 hypothetical protein VIBR0546_01476 [Vibrio brasiliensis LMG 20546]
MSIKTLTVLLIGGVIAAVLLYATALIALTWPISELSINSSGVFGDSFGMLTSLFSGLAFAGLIITIVMQRDELALQRQELNLTREELSGQKEEMKAQNATLKVQRFENTFFKMLDVLENCRNDITVKNPNDRNYHGRDAIKKLYELFTDNYLSAWTTPHGSRMTQRVKAFKQSSKSLEGIETEYDAFYLKYGDELGQYFRTLYNLLKLIERADFLEDKTVYANLLRAQLSRYELLLLWYNCLSIYGNEKMEPLVRKYNILKHLEVSMLPKENQDTWHYYNL